MRTVFPGTALLLAAGCRDVGDDGELVIRAPAGERSVIDDFVARIGDDRIRVDDAPGGEDLALELDLSGPEDSYQFERRGRTLVVHATDVLGLQYGLAEALERLGWRFHHPHRAALPDEIVPVADLDWPGDVVAPEMTVRRGLHLHTLHPIEAYYDFWEPGEGQLDRAKSVIDWIVKSGGDYVQYPGLDDIVRLNNTAPAWTEHTRAIVDYAHARGVKVGIGVQLFGASNLQNAFDLVDGQALVEDAVRERLRILAPAGYDVLSLSFGEFSGEEPETFVSTGNTVVGWIREEMAPEEIVTTIHVGNYEDLRVEYQGQEMLYYFLADFLEGTRPWIHSVMYYNLYEDAGGAYLHDEFDEHRAFLEEHLAAGDPVGYHPESAYWVAFDISIPVYLPVYLRNRFVDFDRLRDQGLEDHVTFSSGWEWGYWQTDRAVLRWAHTLPATWEETVAAEWAAYGADGKLASDTIVTLAEVQFGALVEDRLAAWYASRDTVIDFGDDVLEIISQPDRARIGEIAASTGADLADAEAKVARMTTFAADTRALLSPLQGVREGDPFFDELRDGVEIDAIRAEFAVKVNGAAVAIARGEDPAPLLAEADALLGDAQAVVDRRRAAFHWTGGDRIVQPLDDNAGLYNYGYLGRAHELCYWHRERAEAENARGGAQVPVPPCT